MSCDSTRFESDKLDKLWKNQASQKLYKTLADYENAAADRPNLYGEVYYQKDQVNIQHIATSRGKAQNAEAVQTNILGVTGMIPVLEIVDVFTGEQQAVCERYQLFQ